MNESMPDPELERVAEQRSDSPDPRCDSGTDLGSLGVGPDGEAGDGGPQPLGVTVVPTGHAEVDAGLRRLADADHLMVSAHPEVYEDVHRGLRATLSALDQPAGPRSFPSPDLRS